MEKLASGLQQIAGEKQYRELEIPVAGKQTSIGICKLLT